MTQRRVFLIRDVCLVERSWGVFAWTMMTHDEFYAYWCLSATLQLIITSAFDFIKSGLLSCENTLSEIPRTPEDLYSIILWLKVFQDRRSLTLPSNSTTTTLVSSARLGVQPDSFGPPPSRLAGSAWTACQCWTKSSDTHLNSCMRKIDMSSISFLPTLHWLHLKFQIDDVCLLLKSENE